MKTKDTVKDVCPYCGDELSSLGYEGSDKLNHYANEKCPWAGQVLSRDMWRSIAGPKDTIARAPVVSNREVEVICPFCYEVMENDVDGPEGCSLVCLNGACPISENYLSPRVVLNLSREIERLQDWVLTFMYAGSYFATSGEIQAYANSESGTIMTFLKKRGVLTERGYIIPLLHRRRK